MESHLGKNVSFFGSRINVCDLQQEEESKHRVTQTVLAHRLLDCRSRGFTSHIILPEDTASVFIIANIYWYIEDKISNKNVVLTPAHLVLQ